LLVGDSAAFVVNVHVTRRIAAGRRGLRGARRRSPARGASDGASQLGATPEKAPAQMNIQLTEVLTDVIGVTGQAIIRDIVAGQRDPQALAQHRNRRVKATEHEIVRALAENWREEHLFVLAQALAIFGSLAQRIGECDTKLEQLLAERQHHEVKLVGAAKRGGKNTPNFDLRTTLAR
jgi:transposase